MSDQAADRTAGRIVVDVWSDVMCPFCYLGDTLFQQALRQFPHRDSVDIRYHSFLLMPDLPADSVMDLYELLVTRRGYPREHAEAMNARVAESARQAGLDFRFDRAIATNTHRAHELTHFAAGHGRQHEMVLRLFRAYFTDGRNVGDRDVLADLAAEVGLDRAEAASSLGSGEFTEAVQADLRQAQQLGISAVPFFVFNNTYGVSGAQPVEAFLEALGKTWKETTGTPAGSEDVEITDYH